MTNHTTDVFEGKVRDLTFKGLGVVDHPDGRVFFVPGTWPGDQGLFQIESRKKSYGFARITELTHHSHDRGASPPACPHHGFQSHHCGGCPWMQGSYASQLKYKDQLLRTALERAQLLTPQTQLEPILESPQPLGYRSRARAQTDGKRLGFFASRTHDLIDIETCATLSPETQARWSAYRAQLAKAKKTSLPHSVEIEPERETSKIVSKRRLPFRQANDAQNERMKTWLSQTLSPVPRGPVLELFCGNGNFTQQLPPLGFTPVFALDRDIRQLRSQPMNGVITKKVDLARAESVRLHKSLKPDPTILIFDPPREGFSNLPHWIRALPKLTHVVSISCDVGSFVRDGKELREAGWQLTKAQPIDLFPQTPHIEILSLFVLNRV